MFTKHTQTPINFWSTNMCCCTTFQFIQVLYELLCRFQHFCIRIKIDQNIILVFVTTTFLHSHCLLSLLIMINKQNCLLALQQILRMQSYFLKQELRHIHTHASPFAFTHTQVRIPLIKYANLMQFLMAENNLPDFRSSLSAVVANTFSLFSCKKSKANKANSERFSMRQLIAMFY